MDFRGKQLRQIMVIHDISSVEDIYFLLKESIKDMPQELLEAELDACIGYAKNEKDDTNLENNRNGYCTKTVKSQYGKFPI